MENKRIVWIDLAKAIGIFIVVLGHCDVSYNDFARFLYVLRMPLFFFLSGYLAKNHLPLSQLLKKSFTRLVIPYLFFNFLTALFFLANGLIISRNGMDPDWESRIITPGIATLLGFSTRIFCVSTWFLLSLFWCRLLGYLFDNGSRWSKSAIVIIWLILALGLSAYPIALPFCLDTAIYGVIWFMAGQLLSRVSIRDFSLVTKVFFVIVGFAISYVLFMHHGVCSYAEANPNGLWGLSASALAVASFCCLCQLLERYHHPWVDIISRATLFILGTHILLIVTLNPILHFKGHLGYSFLVSVIFLGGLTWIYENAKIIPGLDRCLKAVYLKR